MKLPRNVTGAALQKSLRRPPPFDPSKTASASPAAWGAIPTAANPTCGCAHSLKTLPCDCLDWFQRFVGYCLTGYTREHVFLFAVGGGA